MGVGAEVDEVEVDADVVDVVNVEEDEVVEEEVVEVDEMEVEVVVGFGFLVMVIGSASQVYPPSARK